MSSARDVGAVPVTTEMPSEVLHLLLKVALTTEQGQVYLALWRLGARLPDGPAELVVGAGTYTVHPQPAEPGTATPPPPPEGAPNDRHPAAGE